VSWVVLIHRVPREPSAPRIAIWRKLRALGVAQLGDGVVALPEDARTREQLEWVADGVLEAGGTALLLRAQAFTRRDEQSIARGMASARAKEYEQVRFNAEEASADAVSRDGVRALRRLRKELRSIQRRDYFPPAERDLAVTAVTELAARLEHSAATSAATPPPAVSAVREGSRS
jgi:F0F1-type ATP synthase epsilon subunit